jgi:peptidyl-prolyl cis-trans isomerase C
MNAVQEKGVTLKKLLLWIMAASMILSIGCAKREDLVLAKVNDRKITIGDFEKASQTMEDKYLPTTNDLAGKKELLDHMINKEVMALKSTSAGYEKEEWFIRFFNRYKGQYLVAAMQNEYVIKKVKVTDEEVKNYYNHMKYEYTLRQINVPSESEAAEIREQIMAGADFADMAKKRSTSLDASDGGYIGPNSIGGILYWVEDALFSMKEGDVSQPLQTPTGWTLVKVERIREIVPDHDINWARQRVTAIKQKQELMNLRHKIEKEIGLFINPEAIAVVYSNLPPDIPMDDIINYRVTRSNAPKLEIPEQYQGIILAKYADGSYTLKDYMKLYDEMSLPDRPRHQYGTESIYDSIHKKILDEALPAYCEQKLKILDIPEVRAGLEKKKEEFLVYRLYDDQVRSRVDVSNMEVEKYYQEHKNELLGPEKRDFSIIITGSKDKADEAVKAARQGEDFTRLVKKYSEDPTVAENMGRSGLVSQGHFTDYDAIAFKLPEGAVSDPLQVPRGWAVVKVWKIEKGQPVAYAEAAQSIKNALVEDKADKLLQTKLAEWRKDYQIKIFESNLKKARLTRTRPAGEASDSLKTM